MSSAITLSSAILGIFRGGMIAAGTKTFTSKPAASATNKTPDKTTGSKNLLFFIA